MQIVGLSYTYPISNILHTDCTPYCLASNSKPQQFPDLLLFYVVDDNALCYWNTYLHVNPHGSEKIMHRHTFLIKLFSLPCMER